MNTRTRIEIAGNCGDKRLLMQLEELNPTRPVDIVNLQLNVPTVKGARAKAPSFMSFEVTSTQQEDIHAFLPAIRDLIRQNGSILVNEVNA